MHRHQRPGLHRATADLVQRQSTYLLLLLVAVVFCIAPLLHSAA